VTELTLDDAKEVIERTKACRPSCDDCSEFTYDALLCRVRGFVDPLPDDFHEKLGKFIGSFLDAGWEEQPHKPSFLRRCAACRQRPEFPWAERLDAEKVLAFMRVEYERSGCFWLGALEQTL